MHSLLNRQLRRQFGDVVPDGLLPFLSMIDRTYRDFDADRMLMERALELSSRELMQANAELGTLIGTFPDLFFRLDDRGVILNCKGGGKDEFLLPAEQLIGKRIQDLPVPEAGRAFDLALARVRDTRTSTSLDYSMQVRGGEAHYEARLVPFLGDRSSPSSGTSRSVGGPRNRCSAPRTSSASPRRWRRWAGWREACPTTSTTSSPPSAAIATWP